MTRQLIFFQRRRTRRQQIFRIIMLTSIICAIQIARFFNIFRVFNYNVSNVNYETRYIQKLLNDRDDVESRIFKFLRMINVMFKILNKWMKKYISLKNFKKNMSVNEKLAIFFFIVDQKISIRLTIETFCHFTKIVVRVFHEMF